MRRYNVTLFGPLAEVYYRDVQDLTETPTGVHFMRPATTALPPTRVTVRRGQFPIIIEDES
jgi:hypothetical protein